MLQGSCSECRFSAMAVQFGTPQLVCRFNPPVVVSVVKGNAAQIISVHPTVEREQVCGRFKSEVAIAG